jgi:WD40 repeat protein
MLADQQEPTVLKTGHAGLQSVVLRSDGRVFATAGWDGRVRVYSSKTMREVAVLKWHKESVYAVGFAEVMNEGRSRTPAGKDGHRVVEGKHDGAESDGGSKEVAKIDEAGHQSVSERRAQETTKKHWLAAGSKDGKISLWDIY